jgi:hypothetical protein
VGSARIRSRDDRRAAGSVVSSIAIADGRCARQSAGRSLTGVINFTPGALRSNSPDDPPLP